MDSSTHSFSRALQFHQGLLIALKVKLNSHLPREYGKKRSLKWMRFRDNYFRVTDYVKWHRVELKLDSSPTCISLLWIPLANIPFGFSGSSSSCAQFTSALLQRKPADAADMELSKLLLVSETLMVPPHTHTHLQGSEEGSKLSSFLWLLVL